MLGSPPPAQAERGCVIVTQPLLIRHSCWRGPARPLDLACDTRSARPRRLRRLLRSTSPSTARQSRAWCRSSLRRGMADSAPSVSTSFSSATGSPGGARRRRQGRQRACARRHRAGAAERHQGTARQIPQDQRGGTRANPVRKSGRCPRGLQLSFRGELARPRRARSRSRRAALCLERSTDRIAQDFKFRERRTAGEIVDDRLLPPKPAHQLSKTDSFRCISRAIPA